MGVEENEVVVEVDVGEVDNRLPLVDLLPQIARGMAAEARRAGADPTVPREARRRLRTASELAERLTEEVRTLHRVAPGSRLFTARATPPDEPR